MVVKASADGVKRGIPREVEALIDYDKAMLWQVDKLGKYYPQWVNTPSSRTHFRMAEWDSMEFFTKMPWYFVPIVWVPLLLWMSAVAMGDTPLPLFAGFTSSQPISRHVFMGAVLFGLAYWTWLEYTLHRFVFHGIPTNSRLGIRAHFWLHGQHHKFPRDPMRLVFPTAAALAIAAIVLGCWSIVCPFHLAVAITVGIGIGYMWYDLSHYYIHHGNPTSGFFKRLKDAHRSHHYKDSTKGYGISNKLWDDVHGTRENIPGKREKLAGAA